MSAKCYRKRDIFTMYVVNTKGVDQTVWMQRLVCIFVVCICKKQFSCEMTYFIIFLKQKTTRTKPLGIIMNKSFLHIQKRSAEIQNFRQQKLARRGILALLLSTDMSYKPFEMKEVSYSVIGPYCLPHHTQMLQVRDCFFSRPDKGGSQ